MDQAAEQSQTKKKQPKTKEDLAALGVKVDKKKSNLKIYLSIVGVIAFGGFLYWGFKPLEGSMNYGICKTYVELDVPYPHTLKFMDLRDRWPIVRMNYSYTDPYGQTIFYPIVCTYDRTPEGRKYLKSVKVNRDKSHPMEDQDRIDLFNRLMGIGLFGEYRPNLVKPPRIPRKITKYRKQ